jgi:hypothetical protein
VKVFRSVSGHREQLDGEHDPGHEEHDEEYDYGDDGSRSHDPSDVNDMSTVLFLTKDHCRLCAAAHPIVEARARRRGHRFEVADGSKQPWAEEFAERLPVVLCDGEVVLEGRFTEREVRRALR